MLKGVIAMDTIQETVSLFNDLIQRLKNIGELLISSMSLDAQRSSKGLKLFWIFNW